MEAKITILGAGSALPTFQNNPSGQILDLTDKSFLIDCGEGVQLTMRQMGIKTSRLYSVFISHLHGDHCFGLLGLIATFGMLHRTQPLHIYAQPDLERNLRPLLDYHCSDISYDLIFHPIHPRKREIIYEDRTVLVETIPLKHGVPTCGFLFYERHRQQDPATQEFYYLTRARYAYVSDTQYKPSIVEQIQGVDLLYHEATYVEADADKGKQFLHSTAKQAAAIAAAADAGQLMIGHFSSRVDDHSIYLREAQEVFENTMLAEERQTYTF